MHSILNFCDLVITAVFKGRDCENRWELGCCTFWFFTSCSPYFNIKGSWRGSSSSKRPKWCYWGGGGWSRPCLSQWLQQSNSELFTGFFIVFIFSIDLNNKSSWRECSNFLVRLVLHFDYCFYFFHLYRFRLHIFFFFFVLACILASNRYIITFYCPNPIILL